MALIRPVAANLQGLAKNLGPVRADATILGFGVAVQLLFGSNCGVRSARLGAARRGLGQRTSSSGQCAVRSMAVVVLPTSSVRRGE